MARVYTRCTADSASPIKLCGPVLPLVLSGLASGLLAALAALIVGMIAIGISVAAANPLAVLIAMIATAYAMGVGLYGGFFEGMCDQWLNRRLICVEGEGDRCAVGRLAENEDVDKSFSNFDLDAFINLRLMPHVPADLGDPASKNYLFTDGQQGQEFLARKLMGRPWSDEAGDYRNLLHCEFESDYWEKVCSVSKVLAPLAPLVVTAATPAIAAACHAIAPAFGFLAPLFELVCTILAPVLATALLALLNLALARLFTDEGSSTDANVGDRPDDPLVVGETVAVRGRFVYDAGHCEGWHEIHPVRKVMRIPATQYLEHGVKREGLVLPELTLPSLSPPDKSVWQDLTQKDMDQGLDSRLFANVSAALRAHWCGALAAAGEPSVTGTQQQPIHRWTVHPEVDGCRDEDGDTPVPDPIH